MATYTSGTPSVHIGPVPKGDYKLVVIAAEEKTSGAGNPMIALKLEVLSPASGAEYPEGSCPKVYDNLVFTASSAWKIDQFRAAIGEEVVEGEEVNVDPDELIGAVLTAHIGLGKNDKGSDRNEIVAYIVKEDDKKPF